MLTKLCVDRKREFFDGFLCKNYSLFFNTKSRMLKVVEQASIKLSFVMN